MRCLRLPPGWACRVEATGRIRLVKSRSPKENPDNFFGIDRAWRPHWIHQHDLMAGTRPGAVRHVHGPSGGGPISPADDYRRHGTSAARFRAWFGEWGAQVPLVQEAHRGTLAMERVLRGHVDVVAAMHRPGLGDIAFVWGEPGRLNRQGTRYNRGMGVAHIIAQRNLEGLVGEIVATFMPTVIALGEIREIQGEDRAGERVLIHYGGATAVLSLYDLYARRSWLLTGWSGEREGGTARVIPNRAYAPGVPVIDPQGGAPSARIVRLNAHLVNASRVVDPVTGAPQPVYALRPSADGAGLLFSTDARDAPPLHGASPPAFYLCIRRPLELVPGAPTPAAAAVQQAGYDGLTARRNGRRWWMVFEPTQVKAVANVGAFDPTSHDVHKAALRPRGSAPA